MFQTNSKHNNFFVCNFVFFILLLQTVGHRLGDIRNQTAVCSSSNSHILCDNNGDPGSLFPQRFHGNIRHEKRELNGEYF